MQQFDNFIGKQYGDFFVEERIGRGGMATVYRARQKSVSRDVALKVIDFKHASNPHDDFQQRFANEASFIASLEHLHILPVYAYGIEGDTAYLAMRLLRGGSIKDLLRESPHMPLELAVQLFRQVAEGLAYAHSKGIIHRDLKPANVLLDDKGNAYLTDFGLAKLINSDREITQQGVIVGTLTYMSPEHLRGERLDQRADIYSMGIMFYEMLCGHPPFANEMGEDMVGIVYKHLEEEPASLSEQNPDISAELEAVVLKALSKKREDRYYDMGEFVKAVNVAMGSNSSIAFPKVSPSLQQGSTVTSVVVPPATKPRNPLVMGAIVATLVIIMVAIGLLYAQQNAPIPDFVLLKGERAEWDAVVPSDAQIATAQRKLGVDGFVAIIACNSDSEYHTTLTRETTTRLKDYGLKFKVYDSQNDAYEQRTEMEKALTDGASAIIFCPEKWDVIDQTLTAIEEQHLPLAAYSVPDNGKEYIATFTATDNSNRDMGLIVGRSAGGMIASEKNGQAKVVILDYPDMQVIVDRADGLQDGVLELAPQATIVGRYLGGTRDNGYNSVKQLLDDNVDFDVIVSINDAGSIGAIKALEEAQVPFDQVAIYSVDAEELAVDYMKKGEYMRGTLEVGRTQTAKSTVDIITRMLAGDSVPEVIHIPLLKVLTQADVTP